MVPPLKLIESGLVVDNVPPQTVEIPLETVRPTGRVSVNATPVSWVALGLDMVKRSVVLAFCATGEVRNSFVRVGAEADVQPVVWSPIKVIKSKSRLPF